MEILLFILGAVLIFMLGVWTRFYFFRKSLFKELARYHISYREANESNVKNPVFNNPVWAESCYQ